MAKNNKTEPERLNQTISPELTEDLNAYCLKVGNAKKKMPRGLKSIIVRKAIKEWLINHGDDVHAWE